MDRFKAILDKTIDLFSGLSGFALILMLVHVNVDVIGKYFFSVPVPLTIEIVSHFYMVAVVFLPLALVERGNAHISVELFSQYFSDRIKRWQSFGVMIVCALYYMALTYRTFLDALDKLETREFIMGSMPVPIWPVRFFLPLGCGLITIVLLYKAWCRLSGRDPGSPTSDEVVGP